MVTRVYPDRSGTPVWFEQTNQGVSVVSKNGGGEGFHSIFSFVPGKGDAVIMPWTSSKAADNDLFQQTAQLLSDVCGVPGKGAVNTIERGAHCVMWALMSPRPTPERYPEISVATLRHRVCSPFLR
jgi:hypothetical protein